MIIQCIDETEGRLFLAAEFLHFLNNLNEQVRLLLPQESIRLYGRYFDLFPKIEIQTKKSSGHRKSADVVLRFRDKMLHEISQKELVYPLLAKKELSAWQENAALNPASVIPCDTSREIADTFSGELDSASDLLSRRLSANDFSGKHLLISAGPTAEDIDPVRYLTNRSTGKMGLALARAAFIRGADVRLIMGPSALKPPSCLYVNHVRSARQMADAIFSYFDETDIYVGAAAVADYTPHSMRSDKLKKGKDDFQLILQRTADILQALSRRKKEQLLIGFSVETEREFEFSKNKLEKKNLDFIVINNPKQPGSAFAGDTNQVSIYSKEGDYRKYPLLSKGEVSHLILDLIRERLQNR